MYDGFVRLLNMSFAAGVLAAVVALLRLLLKKAPRKIICILWALVALRLVCPMSIGSSLSAFNLLSRDVETNGQIEYFEYNGKTEKPMVEFTVPPIEAEEETAQQTHTKYFPLGTCFTVADRIRPSVGLLTRAFTMPSFGSLRCLSSTMATLLVR